MKHLLWLLAAGVLLCAGCDRLFWVGVSPDSTPDHPVFLLGNQDDYSGTAWIYSASVSRRPRKLAPGDSLNTWHTCWEIHMDSGFRYLKVHRVDYGIVPKDFHVVSGPETLPAGQLYAFSPTIHGLGMNAYFELYLDSAGSKAIRILSEDQFLAIISDTIGH
jgi:hypothetical protein